MVKLIAARANRLYGPGETKSVYEILNAIVYFLATLSLLAGMILLLANFSHPLTYDTARVGLILLAISLCIIIVINMHDLVAQVAGIDFRLHLLAYDTQLALVEIGAPLIYIIGSVLFLIAVIFMLKSKIFLVGGREGVALQLLIAGSVCWVLGSLDNSCQVYDRAGSTLQVYQKAVYLPLLVASTLLLISSILWLESWPHFVVAHSAQYAAIVIAITASGLIVFAATVNILRVFYLRRLVRAFAPSQVPLDTLRGRAYDELEEGSVSRLQPLLETEAPPGAPPPASAIVEEETFAVIR